VRPTQQLNLIAIHMELCMTATSESLPQFLVIIKTINECLSIMNHFLEMNDKINPNRSFILLAFTVLGLTFLFFTVKYSHISLLAVKTSLKKKGTSVQNLSQFLGLINIFFSIINYFLQINDKINPSRSFILLIIVFVLAFLFS
jgi:uncharacterized membrane protein